MSCERNEPEVICVGKTLHVLPLAELINELMECHRFWFLLALGYR